MTASSTIGRTRTQSRGGTDLITAGLRTTGELLITAGLVVILFLVYELYFTGIATHQAQSRLNSQLLHSWDAGPVATTPAGKPAPVVPLQLGAGFAILRAPVISKSWHYVIVEGVGQDQLADGPGHYPGTAAPGAIGNFVVSGHRTTHAAPFYDINELTPGKAVLVETQQYWYVYKVTSQEAVAPTDVGEVLPVPNRPGVKATTAQLTLTTCNPRYSASQRLIIHATLASRQLRSAGNPKALTTGLA